MVFIIIKKRIKRMGVMKNTDSKKLACISLTNVILVNTVSI